MAHFKYEAVDTSGASHAGELESGSRSAALELLQRRGLTPLTLSDGSVASAPSVFDKLRRLLSSNRASLGTKELVSLTQSLAALLRAGLTIDRALSITSSLERHPQTRALLADLGKAVRAGRSFADALVETKLTLPPYYVGMVQAGEVGGSLASASEHCGQQAKVARDCAAAALRNVDSVQFGPRRQRVVQIRC